MITGYVEDEDEPGFDVFPENFVDLAATLHEKYKVADQENTMAVASLISDGRASYSRYLFDKIKSVLAG